MWNPLQSDRTPIVIDLHDDHVVALQLLRRKGKWESGASVTIRREATADASASAHSLSEGEIAAVERSLVRQGAIGRDVILMSPPGVTCIELLELPPRTPQTPIDQLARAEIGRLARWDDSTPFQLCTWDVPDPVRRPGSEAPATTSLYAAAVQEASVETTLRLAWAQCWWVKRMVPAPLAAAAVVSELVAPRGQASSASIVVDLRNDRAAVTVVRDSAAIYHRDLPDNGLSLLLRGLVAELRLTPADAASAIELGTFSLSDSAQRGHAVCEGFAEALATELEASLAFAARRYGELRGMQLLVVGPGARLRGLSEWLAARLDLEDRGATAIDGCGPDLALAMPVAVARLSTRLAAGESMLPARQQDLIRREQVARRWLAAAAAVAVVALTTAATLYTSAFTPAAPNLARKAGLQREQTRADQEAGDARRKLAEVTTLARFEDRVRNQPDYGTLLAIIGSALDPSAALREVSLSEPSSTRAAGTSADVTAVRRLKLVGSAPSASLLTSQVTALRALDIFDRVELARTSRSASGEGVSFELTMDVVARSASTGAK